MIDLDEDALICDFAETYQIYDYRSLPPKTVATLAAGLRDDSRIKLRASGLPVSQDTLLLATISDRIEALRYGFSQESKSGKQPFSLVRFLLGEEQTQKKDNNSETMAFDSPEDLMQALAKARGEK